MLKRLITLVFLVFSFLGFSRNKENIDSLIAYGKKHQIDTLLSYSYNVAAQNYKFSNIDTAYQLAKTGLNYALKANHLLYISDSYNILGVIDKDKGGYELAINYQKLALSYALKYKGNSDIQQLNALSSMGLVYWEQGNFSQALEMYYNNLLVAKKSNDSVQIARILTNIGSVYFDQEMNDKALEKYAEAYQLVVKLNHVFGQCLLLNNLGSVYYQQKDYANANKNFLASLKISEEINDLEGIAVSYINIGALYFDKQQYDTALVIHQKALAIKEQMQDKQGISSALNEIGKDYCELGQLDKAIAYSEKSLKIAKEVEALDYIKSAHQALFKTYDKSGNISKAYFHYKEFISLRDSMANDENRKKDYRNELNFEYQSKQYKDSLEQVKKDFITTQELDKEKIKTESQRKLTILFSVSFIIMLLLSIFIFRGYKNKKQANIIIQQQKEDVEKQRDVISEQHKEITDSINYAERIQRSFLATSEMLDKYLGVTSSTDEGGVSRSERNYFVFFRPKDVVSGDFYWAAELNNGNFAFSVADSTGHGVPGSIMSILNISSLEKSIEKETTPDKILNQTRRIIIDRLKNDGSPDGGKDGMDCSLLVINQDRTQLSFAAANNPVFILRPTVIASCHSEPVEESMLRQAQHDKNDIRNDGYELIEFKPDKMPVGKHDNDTESFTLHTALLQKGDVIYALTDGFPDQFGGDKGKKYMIKNLKELLLQIAHLPMLEQEQKLADEFDKWKGSNEQVDDVCIIGVRV